MKSKRLFLALAALCSVLASGCATRNTSSGGRETATINVDTSKLVGSDGPSGKKVTVLWGLLTFTDY
jgi:predicted small secreted protein